MTIETPILDKLTDKRIFGCWRKENGNFNFQQQCGNYFNLELSPDEVLALVAELVKLVEAK